MSLTEQGANFVDELQKRTFWRTVTLGLHQTPEAYLASIEGRGVEIDRSVREIAELVTCSKEQVVLQLQSVRGADQGLSTTYTNEQFVRKAPFGHYRLCPAEVGLALADQPERDYRPFISRRIGMEGIMDSHNSLCIFDIIYLDGKWWLNGTRHPRSRRWRPGSRWIMTTSKPSA